DRLALETPEQRVIGAALDVLVPVHELRRRLGALARRRRPLAQLRRRERVERLGREITRELRPAAFAADRDVAMDAGARLERTVRGDGDRTPVTFGLGVAERRAAEPALDARERLA